MHVVVDDFFVNFNVAVAWTFEAQVSQCFTDTCINEWLACRALLSIHAELPSVLRCGKPRVALKESSTPIVGIYLSP